MQLGDMRRAELSLRRAQGNDPLNSEARLLMGYLRLKQGKTAGHNRVVARDH